MGTQWDGLPSDPCAQLGLAAHLVTGAGQLGSMGRVGVRFPVAYMCTTVTVMLTGGSGRGTSQE